MTLARILYPSSEKLRFLLESIHNREVALPDFQRDFVWDPRATEELIESILQNYPAGSLLRIKNRSGFFFAPREVAGAPALNGHSPSYLVLDGQQRLTSLYQALYGTGNHRYFISLRGLLDGEDLDDCVFYLRKQRAERRFGTMEKQASDLVFPLEVVFGHSYGFETWLDHVLEQREETKDASKELARRVSRNRRRRPLSAPSSILSRRRSRGGRTFPLSGSAGLPGSTGGRGRAGTRAPANSSPSARRPALHSRWERH